MTTNPDTYAQLGDLQLEAVGEDELTTHWQTAIHDEVARDLSVVDMHSVAKDIGATFVPIPAEAWAAAIDEEPEDDTGEDVVAVQRAAFVVWATALILGGAIGVIGWLELANAS
jgi:hypothetical protein